MNNIIINYGSNISYCISDIVTENIKGYVSIVFLVYIYYYIKVDFNLLYLDTKSLLLSILCVLCISCR